MKLLVNKTPIDWLSEESYYFFNPQHPKTKDLKKREIPILKSHIYLYTSGFSKICLLSKKAFLHSACLANKNLQASTKDKWLISLPLYHVGGISILARAFLSGSSYFINKEAWNPNSFKRQIEREKITLSSLVPTQVYDLVGKGLKAPSSLRVLLVGGDFLSSSLYQKARDLGWPLLLCYGATETSSHIAVSKLSSLKKKTKPPMKLLEGVELFPYQKKESIKKTGYKKTQDKETLNTSFFKVKTEGLLTAYFDLKRKTLFDPKDEEGCFLLEDKLCLKNKTLIPCQDSHSCFFDDRKSIKLLSPSPQIKILGEKVSLNSLVFQLEKSFQNIQKALNFKKKSQKQFNKEQFKAYLIPLPEERQGWSLILVGEIKDFEQLFLLKQDYNKQIAAYERIQALYFLEKDPLHDFLKIKAENLIERLGFSF